MAAKPKILNGQLWIAFIAISLPLLLAFMSKDNKPNLVGIVISDEKPELTSENWLSGSYQNEMDDYNNDHWALKEITVRLNNQFYYKAFNQIRVNSFVLGKENYVFSEGYIFSAFGDDYIGSEKVKALAQKAKVLQDTLKKKGIDLMFVFAPGKGEFCKEFVEDKYVHPVVHTNHDEYVTQCREAGINYLDLYAWFNQIKPSCPYPLFPRFGHHWSYYGECIAVDTIIGYMEKLHHCDMPDITWKKIDEVDTARSRDADVLKSMNLYHNPEQNMKLAYPEVMFEQDSVKNQTRVLTISDSYWYGPVYMGVPQACFAGGQFWYYNNKIIPNPSATEKVEVWQLNLKEAIEQNKIIMLLYSDGNLSAFGNSFIENAYELYTSPKTYWAKVEKNKPVQTYAKQIREKPLLLKKATQKSKDLQIPLDSAIKLDASKMAGIK
ncbi:MAG: alginate O-acetyltransferase AlgX-related protein [Bacteroidia bacterium]